MRAKTPYECCRCGYSTSHKACMRHHLYSLVKSCSGSKNVIDLTDDIKERILMNSIYHLPVEQAPPTINQIINNNNTIINYIARMDTVCKINKYIEHTRIPMIDFEQSIENKFDRKAKKLECNSYRHGFSLKETDFLEIIDEISNVHAKIDEVNIVYDSKWQKLKVYEAGLWEELLVTSGLKKIIEMVQSYYFNAYECYLIRNIHIENVAAIQKQHYRELLQVYYKFLAAFNVLPYVKGQYDNAILYNEYDDRREEGLDKYTLEEKFLSEYNKVAKSTTMGESNTLRKSVLEIIKRNSLKNIEDMNNKLLDLFNMDPAFKESLIIPQ